MGELHPSNRAIYYKLELKRNRKHHVDPARCIEYDQNALSEGRGVDYGGVCFTLRRRNET